MYGILVDVERGVRGIEALELGRERPGLLGAVREDLVTDVALTLLQLARPHAGRHFVAEKVVVRRLLAAVIPGSVLEAGRVEAGIDPEADLALPGVLQDLGEPQQQGQRTGHFVPVKAGGDEQRPPPGRGGQQQRVALVTFRQVGKRVHTAHAAVGHERVDVLFVSHERAHPPGGELPVSGGRKIT